MSVNVILHVSGEEAVFGGAVEGVLLGDDAQIGVLLGGDELGGGVDARADAQWSWFLFRRGKPRDGVTVHRGWRRRGDHREAGQRARRRPDPFHE